MTMNTIIENPLMEFNDDSILTTTNNYNDLDFSKLNYGDDLTIWNRRAAWEVALKSLVVIPIMALGLIGNAAIIYIILKIKSLRKSTINLFILNMAIADFLTTLFCPWIALVDNIYQNYELGPFICKMENFIKVMCLLASVLSLVTISCDRFIAIVYPFNRHLTKNASYLIIILIWILAITLSCPFAIWRTYKERQWADYLEKWCPEEETVRAKYYWMFILIPLIYFPLIVMIIVYSIIIIYMERYEKTLSINETPVKIKHRRTLIKMLFTYIITTFICWFPLQILVYYRHFKLQTSEISPWFNDVCFISQLFASTNAAIYPIVTFRKTFSHLLPKLFFSKKKNNSRIIPLEIAIIQQQFDLARPSAASNETNIKMNNFSNGITSNTTTITKHIMMKRVPEIFMQDDT